MRILLAFRVFFAVLFGWPMPDEILLLAPGGSGSPDSNTDKLREVREALAQPPKPEPATAPVPVRKVMPTLDLEPPPPPPKAVVDHEKHDEAAAVRVLGVLQAEGRLLDFLSEDIEGYSDADIGAAARDVHKGLKRALADHFPVVPLRSEAEDASMTVPEGFDPQQIRLVGNVIGKPPFSGKLKHKGWKVTAVRLPRPPNGAAAMVVTPAEVEL